jgi:hypothetical protein
MELTCEHQKKGNVRQIILHPARGDYKGFRSKRKVQIIIEGLAPPRAVSEGNWHYDGTQLTLHIDLGSLDLRQQHCIDIEEASPQQHKKVQGLKGLFTRLAAVNALISSTSPTHPKHPDERLAVRVAQTGRRISLHPETFADEYKDLTQSLQQLPEVLQTMQQNYQDSKKAIEADAEQIIARARQILDGCV